MKSIFISLIFLFFHFNLNIGSVAINLFPDFIGYILILIGLRKISNVNRNFEKIRPIAIAMCVYSSIEFVLGFFNFSLSTILIWTVILFSLLSSIITFCVIYSIVKCVEDVELRRGCNLNTSKLKTVLKIIIICVLLSVLLSFFISTLLSLICTLVSWVAIFIFMVNFYKTTKLYITLPAISCEDCNQS